MDIVDLQPAIDTGDRNTIRAFFRALVDYPNEEEIRCAGPGHLITALDRVCAALDRDNATMPATTCAALQMTVGASYSDGAAWAQAHKSDVCRAFTTSYVRSTAGAL